LAVCIWGILNELLQCLFNFVDVLQEHLQYDDFQVASPDLMIDSFLILQVLNESPFSPDCIQEFALLKLKLVKSIDDVTVEQVIVVLEHLLE
jgi:hypothetical protein